jgi:hypothetical protein
LFVERQGWTVTEEYTDPKDSRQAGGPLELAVSFGPTDELHDEALWRAAEQTDLFVEVDPNPNA